MSKEYWNDKLHKYAEADWSQKPNIFGEIATEYFPPKSDVLELTAGVGQDGRYFASKGFKVTTTDFSETAIHYLQSNITDDIKSNITVETLDISKEFPYPNESFDVVYSHLGIHYFTMEVTTQLFREVNRVLKTGGIFAVLTNSVNDPEFEQFQDKKIEEELLEVNGVVKRYFSIETVRKLAEENGFEIIMLDYEGTTYKDQEMGVYNLLRFVGKKK